MKVPTILSLILALSASNLAIAQSGNMKEMPMKDMDRQKCMDMQGMKGMDMKDMDMQHGKSGQAKTHTATGVVKEVDAANGKVTLAHGPVKSLNWPAMTMGFAVKDKALLDKLTVGKKVHVGFTKQGNDYVVTSVK